MDTLGFGLTILALLLLYPWESEAFRCLHCEAVQSPNDCTVVTDCTSDEYCLTQKLVTTSGISFYKLGCIPKADCAPSAGLLVGKRSSNNARRDVTQCKECCMGNFCNNYGCGTHSVTSAPIVTSAPVTTPAPTITTTTPVPATTKHTFHCDTHAGNQVISNGRDSLCVHIHTYHRVTWQEARNLCERDGGDLVVLDTLEKSIMMRNEIHHKHSTSFWIGAKDFQATDHYVWVDGTDVTESDWGQRQPDFVYHGHDEDCVCLQHYAGYTDYKWHDRKCWENLAYICEFK